MLALALACGSGQGQPGPASAPAKVDPTARELVVAAWVAHGGEACERQGLEALVMRYAGEVEVEGHYRLPGQVETTEVSGLYPFADAAALSPQWLLAAALAEGAELGSASVDSRAEAPGLWRVPLRDRYGDQWTLHIDSAHLLVGAERRFGHDRLGDTSETIEFGQPRWQGACLVSTRLEYEVHELDYSVAVALSLDPKPESDSGTDPASESAPGSAPGLDLPSLRTPRAAQVPAGGEPGASALAPKVAALVPGTFVVEVPEAGIRVLVVELEDGLAVVEAPLGSAISEAVVDAIHGHDPRPIRYLILTHHHPHHAGGLRAFVHAGAQIVTTPEAGAWLRTLAQRPRTLVPDRLALDPKTLTIIEVGEAGWGVGPLEVFDIGETSGHTREHLVVYHRDAALIIVGDLSFRREGAFVATEGGRGVIAAVTERGLEVDLFAQAWPLEGTEASYPYSSFVAAHRD